jgi:hypothetical protein
VFNIITAVLGLAFLCASLYAEGQTTGNGWSAIVARNVAWVGVFASLLTMFASCVGCWAATTGRRNVLCCYLCFFTLIFAFQVAAAVSMSQYSKQLRVQDASVLSGALVSQADVNIMNAVFSVYQKCCSGCPNNACNNPQTGAFVNATNANCLQANCQYVTSVCQSTTQDKCWNFLGQPPLLPPYVIEDQLCQAMSTLQLNGIKLVGPAQSGSCGGGDPKVFWTNLNMYVSGTVYGVAIFYIIVAFFESLILPAGIYVMFCTKTETPLEEIEDKETRMETI